MVIYTADRRDPARLDQKQITPISRAATLEENIDYILNIGVQTLTTNKLITNELIHNSLRYKESRKPTAKKET